MHNFIKQLSLSEGIDVTVFALYYPYNRAEYGFYNAKVFSFGKNTAPGTFGKLRSWRKCEAKFKREHSNRKFDIVHSLWSREAGFIAARLSRKLKIPMITTVSGGEAADLPQINFGSQVHNLEKYFVEKSFEQAESIITLSDYITAKVNTIYKNRFQDKIKTLPFGVDEEMFYPVDDKRSMKLINIANAVPVKAHSDLFKAMKIVIGKYPEYTLECYGRDDKDILKALAEESEVSASVRLNGFTPYKKTPDALNNADIYVLSSLYEAENMSILEAAFCGLPVISTGVGIAPEITTHLAEAGDYKMLAQKIVYAIENYEDEKIKSLEKIPGLQKRFSLKNCTDNYIELYKSL